MTDVSQLLEQRRNMFIATRRDIEVWIDKFFSEIDKVRPELLKDITFPTGRTAQELFPALYKEPFDEEQYNKEYADFNAFYEKVMEVADYLNSKAREVLQG